MNSTNPAAMLKRFLMTATFVFASALMAVMVTALGVGAQELQKGVSVQMAVTTSAVNMPEADYNDAWVVAVTEDGSLYFGVKPVTYDGLVEEMRIHPRRRDAKLYIKADVRAPFASVQRALEATHVAEFDGAVLLTAQPESPAPGIMVPPKGIEVSFSAPANAPSVELEPGQPTPRVRVSNGDESWAGLKNSIREVLHDSSDKTVVVRAAGQVPALQVIYTIDVAHSTGAKVVLPTAKL